MKHPFANIIPLTPAETECTSGAGDFRVTETQLVVRSPNPVIRPPVMTTMAIGEEGGGFDTLEVM